MGYEIHLKIPEGSRRGHLIASIAAEQHITPSQAVEKIIDQATQRVSKTSLAPDHQETPTELVDRLRAHKKALGAAAPRSPKSTANPEAFFGMMAGNKEFSRTMDEIIAGRPKRYGFEE
jgi:hypothetical protein